MSAQTIVQHLRAFDTEALRGNLAECPPPADGTPVETVIDDAVAWVDSLRADTTALVTGIDNAEDVNMAVAIQYVELKSRWIAFNTKMNYEMFRGQTPQPRDMCRAAAVSAFLGHLEPLLEDSDVDKITEFLAQPLNNAA